MKKEYFILVILSSIVVYILLINFVANIIYYENFTSLFTDSDDGTVKIGVGNKVSFAVKRNRFYGSYDMYEDKVYLNLFKIIKIPLEIKGLNFRFAHIFFFLVICFFVYKYRRLFNKEKVYKDEEAVFNYEELG